MHTTALKQKDTTVYKYMYQCHAVKLTSETNECQKSKFTTIYVKRKQKSKQQGLEKGNFQQIVRFQSFG